jgi:hypothetical protein
VERWLVRGMIEEVRGEALKFDGNWNSVGNIIRILKRRIEFRTVSKQFPIHSRTLTGRS